MSALTSKTAGVAKKLFMTGVYPNGNKVKAGKMEDNYNNLMNYANRLEETHPSQARTLKAELHKRAMELSLNNVQDKAEMVHDGTTHAHAKVLKIKEMVARLASEVNETAKTTKATAALSGALQTSVADAKAKTAAAGEHGVSSASSSDAAMEKKEAIVGQLVNDYHHVANEVLKQDDEKEVVGEQINILGDLWEDSKDKAHVDEVKREILEERLRKSNETIEALEEELEQLRHKANNCNELNENYAAASMDLQDLANDNDLQKDIIEKQAATLQREKTANARLRSQLKLLKNDNYTEKATVLKKLAPTTARL